jgi:tRNA pseudouridine38-40 synthase
MRSIDAYGGPDLRYFNSQGIVPEICVVKQGKERNQGFKEKKKFDSTTFTEENDAVATGDIDGLEDGDDDEQAEVDKGLLAEMEG